MEFFLRARHWLLFIFLFLPTLISYGVQFGLPGFMENLEDSFTAIDAAEDSGQMIVSLIRAYSPYVAGYLLIYLVSELVKVGWRYSVGARLYADRPPGLSMNFGLFKAANVVQATLALIFVGLMFYFYEPAIELVRDLSNDNTPAWLENEDEAVSVLLKFGGFWLIYYLLYYGTAIAVSLFNGRVMVALEHGRRPGGSEYFGQAILWFIPFIGVWIHQPKINRYVETGTIAKGGPATGWEETKHFVE